MSITKPSIEVYTICYNEEVILPFFLEYYSKFCDKITIFDNQSTDNTPSIIKDFKNANICEIEHSIYDSNNKLDDSIYLDLKNNCWKNSKFDYVIIVDCDEFLYHKNLNEFLTNTSACIYKPHGYDMVSEEFPIGTDILQIQTGVFSENYSKMVIFKPDKINEINYSLGCHSANPSFNNETSQQIVSCDGLKLLHYKNLSFNYRYSKHVSYIDRLSDFNKSTGSGIHYLYDKEKQMTEYLTLLNNSINIFHAE